MEKVKVFIPTNVPGDFAWETTLFPYLKMRLIFQEPDLADNFPGSTTLFFSGESIFRVPVEIAETLSTLFIGRCLQGAEVFECK